MGLVDIHICCQVVFGFVYVLVREGSVTWKRLVKMNRGSSLCGSGCQDGLLERLMNTETERQ